MKQRLFSRYYGWVIVAASCAIMMTSFGNEYSFGGLKAKFFDA